MPFVCCWGFITSAPQLSHLFIPSCFAALRPQTSFFPARDQGLGELAPVLDDGLACDSREAFHDAMAFLGMHCSCLMYGDVPRSAIDEWLHVPLPPGRPP